MKLYQLLFEAAKSPEDAIESDFNISLTNPQVVFSLVVTNRINQVKLL